MKSNFNSLFSKVYAYGDHTHQTLSCTEYVLKYDLENDLMYDLKHFFNKAILYLFITPLLANREQSASQPITTCLSLSSHPHGSGNSVVPCTLVLNLYFSTHLICFMVFIFNFNTCLVLFCFHWPTHSFTSPMSSSF